MSAKMKNSITRRNLTEKTVQNDAVRLYSNTNEVLPSGDDDWYYDEIEMIWKHNLGEMLLKRVLSIALPGVAFAQSWRPLQF